VCAYVRDQWYRSLPVRVFNVCRARKTVVCLHPPTVAPKVLTFSPFSPGDRFTPDTSVWTPDKSLGQKDPLCMYMGPFPFAHYVLSGPYPSPKRGWWVGGLRTLPLRVLRKFADLSSRPLFCWRLLRGREGRFPLCPTDTHNSAPRSWNHVRYIRPVGTPRPKKPSNAPFLTSQWATKFAPTPCSPTKMPFHPSHITVVRPPFRKLDVFPLWFPFRPCRPTGSGLPYTVGLIRSYGLPSSERMASLPASFRGSELVDPGRCRRRPSRSSDANAGVPDNPPYIRFPRPPADSRTAKEAAPPTGATWAGSSKRC